jgi:hypothetical protein
MKEKSKNYVGVSGIASVEEAHRVLPLIRASGLTLETGHVPMLGFQVSYKSLEFGFSEGNNRVPRFEMLPAILETIKGEVFPTIHYYTKNKDRLLLEIHRVMGLDGIYSKGLVKGLQINGIWPKTEEMEEIKAVYPELKVVLQISPKVTEGMTTDQVAKKIAKRYADFDYLILDASRGKGIEFDVAETASIYRNFRNHGVEARIIFAGGLNGDNVKEKVTQLKEMLGSQDFSIDAEGGLRNKLGEGYGNDLLDLGKVESYLKGASEALHGLKR